MSILDLPFLLATKPYRQLIHPPFNEFRMVHGEVAKIIFVCAESLFKTNEKRVILCSKFEAINSNILSWK